MDQAGCALKACAAFLRSADTKLFPTLLIHLYHLDRALDRARKERADPQVGTKESEHIFDNSNQSDPKRIVT